MSKVDHGPIISELVGQAYPPALRAGGRIRRNWVVRTVRTLPPQSELDELRRKLEEWVSATIQTAYGDVVPLERVAAAFVLFRIDELHVLVSIEYADSEKNIGDAAVIAQWGALQFLDCEIEFEDLQGLPCAYWRLLRKDRPNT